MPYRAATGPAPVALALTACVGVAGCGGAAPTDGDGTGSSPTTTVTTTVTATATATTTVTETVTSTPRPSRSPRTRDCGDVAFEANTDNGAFDIRATGVGCETARAVARMAEGQRGERYRAAEGFRCRPTGTVGQLPSVVYECTRQTGGSIVFEAS